MCEQFGVWGEKSFMGKTYDGIHRISFLIDADGKSNMSLTISKPAITTTLC